MCVTGLDIGVACLVAMRLTALDVNHYDTPTIATSYDGKERSVERFYDNKRPEFKVGMDFYFDTNTRVGLKFDNGYDADKYHVSRKYTVSGTQYFKLTDGYPTEPKGAGWSVTVSGLYEFGGKETHTPCRDSYNREYYCGNLTAWSDYEQPEHKNTYAGRITFKRRF